MVNPPPPPHPPSISQGWAFRCLSGLWLSGLLHLFTLLKLVCYAHVFPCIFIYTIIYTCIIRRLLICAAIHVYTHAYYARAYTCIYFSKPLRLLYSLIVYERVNFLSFALYSLLLLSFFLYLITVHYARDCSCIHTSTYVRACCVLELKMNL